MSWLTAGATPSIVKVSPVKTAVTWKFRDVLGNALKRKDEDDDTDYDRLRPSSLANLHVVDFVKEALGIIKPLPSSTPRRTMLTFLIGKAVHDWIQNCLALNYENMYADWECKKCGVIIRSVGPKGIVCRCGCNVVAYREPFLGYPNGSADVPVEFCIGGRPDIIIVRKEEGKVCIVDLKTSNDMWFGNLDMTGPSVEYVVQIMIYMWLVELEMKYVSDGRLYYVNKNDASEKEFGIKISHVVIQRVMFMQKFFQRCMIDKKVSDGFDLVDMNRSIIEIFGKDYFLDYWYPVS